MNSSRQSVGFIGIGAMGAPMVERLLERGYPVAVWNRTASRADALVAAGATRADTPAALMHECDVIGVCLADGAAVDAIADGPAGLLSAPSPRARIVIDFSTIDPALAKSLSDRAAAVGLDWIDCPVSGGVPAARAGSLIGFAGDANGALARVHDVTCALFSKVTVMGGSGAGQLAKLCNQIVVASNLLVIAEAIAAARAFGIDVAKLPEALAGGFADSKPLQIFGPRMAAHAFEPRMGAIRLMLKDARLALGLADAHGATLPMLSHAAALYERAGHTPGMALDDDISSVIRLLERPDRA